MKLIPTAEELFVKCNPQDGTLPQWAKDLMIEFAKLHVKAALEVAQKDAQITESVAFQSILNAYPDENIK